MATKLLFVRKPSKTFEFSYCATNYLLVLNKFKGPSGIDSYNYQHVHHVGLKPLLEQVYNRFSFPNHGDRGTHGA